MNFSAPKISMWETTDRLDNTYIGTYLLVLNAWMQYSFANFDVIFKCLIFQHFRVIKVCIYYQVIHHIIYKPYYSHSKRYRAESPRLPRLPVNGMLWGHWIFSWCAHIMCCGNDIIRALQIFIGSWCAHKMWSCIHAIRTLWSVGECSPNCVVLVP